MKTEKAAEILEEIIAEYESKRRRDAVIVLNRAKQLLIAHGMPADVELEPARKPRAGVRRPYGFPRRKT